MKFIKKSPLFLILLLTGILFTLAAAAGRSSIYAEQEYDILKAPLLSVLFAGINDDLYPWQLFERDAVETAALKEAAEPGDNGEEEPPKEDGPGSFEDPEPEITPEPARMPEPVDRKSVV